MNVRVLAESRFSFIFYVFILDAKFNTVLTWQNLLASIMKELT